MLQRRGILRRRFERQRFQLDRIHVRAIGFRELRGGLERRRRVVQHRAEPSDVPEKLLRRRRVLLAAELAPILLRLERRVIQMVHHRAQRVQRAPAHRPHRDIARRFIGSHPLGVDANEVDGVAGHSSAVILRQGELGRAHGDELPVVVEALGGLVQKHQLHRTRGFEEGLDLLASKAAREGICVGTWSGGVGRGRWEIANARGKRTGGGGRRARARWGGAHLNPAAATSVSIWNTSAICEGGGMGLENE